MRALNILVHHSSWMDQTLESFPSPHRILRDPALVREADVVLFHLPTLQRIGINKYPNQLWVAWTLESDENYPILKTLKAKARGYFDLWMTYQQEAEIWCPYFDSHLNDRISSAPRIRDQLPASAYFGSNGNDLARRSDFVQELMKHTRVDSFGKCLNNMPAFVDCGRETKLQTIGRYKFTLALENSFAKDYVTEKFFDPLLAGSVPVYRGAPNIEEFAPGENCLIDANQFENPRELAEYLNRVAQDDDLYEQYHQWRHLPLRGSFLEMLERLRVHPLDQLSERYEAAFRAPYS